jgi:hypothetical protein
MTCGGVLRAAHDLLLRSSLAGMAFAGIGILVSDKIEERYPVEQRTESVPIVIDRS